MIEQPNAIQAQLLTPFRFQVNDGGALQTV